MFFPQARILSNIISETPLKQQVKNLKKIIGLKFAIVNLVLQNLQKLLYLRTEIYDFDDYW